MKMAPLLRAFQQSGRIRSTLIHTGQHYDPLLSNVFFDQLGIHRPDRHLDVGSGTQASQTARVLERMEATLLDGDDAGRRFDGLVVVGDVNSTVAASIAAAKLLIPVCHVEAGLRSNDRTMPEEVNRVLTDAISDLLMVSEPSGVENLRREGHSDSRIHLVGNVMIDTLLQQLESAREISVARSFGVSPRQYAVMTLHRPANVDHEGRLTGLVAAMKHLSRVIDVVFPVHPRTRDRLQRFGLLEAVNGNGRIKFLDPQGYHEFLALTSQAKLVITDSGGLQEECTALGVPCLVLRSNTERPITVDIGTCTLVGDDSAALQQCVASILTGNYRRGQCPALWDGKASERIAQVILDHWPR